VAITAATTTQPVPTRTALADGFLVLNSAAELMLSRTTVDAWNQERSFRKRFLIDVASIRAWSQAPTRNSRRESDEANKAAKRVAHVMNRIHVLRIFFMIQTMPQFT